MRNLGIFLMVLLFSCGSPDKENNVFNNDNLIINSLDEVNPSMNEETVFRTVIDSVYPQIYKNEFDTLMENAFIQCSNLEEHRLISILLAKNKIKRSDLEKISSLHRCTCKHFSVKKKDSPDFVIEEYVCKNADDASFWFNMIYDCYLTHENPIGEPLKEPYKIWQSDNRIIHVYTRAEMWRTALDSINISLMKNFVFDGNKNE